MFDPSVFLIDCQCIEELLPSLGSRQKEVRRLPRGPQTLFAVMGVDKVQRTGHEHNSDVAWQEGHCSQKYVSRS